MIPRAEPFPLPISAWQRVAIVTLALCGIALLAVPVLRLWTQIPINYNEGWNAYQIERALASWPLYPPADALVTNNYPPLSFYLVGGVSRLVGDHIIAGRLVALAGFLLVAVEIGLLVFAGSRSVWVSLFSSVAFVLFGATRWTHYLAMCDPQWLAHAMALGGLVILSRTQSSSAALAAGSLMAVALFVKHNVIPLPAAALIYVVARPSRSGGAWAAGFIATAVALAVGCTWQFGWQMWQGILLSSRDLSVWHLANAANEYLTPVLSWAGPVMVVVAAWGDWRRLGFPLLYVGMACLWGIVCLAGDGVNVNAVFDIVIGLSLLTGLAVGRPSTTLATSVARQLATALIVGVSAALLIPLPLTALRGYSDIRQLPARQLEAKADIAAISRVSGPVACETLALCYWAGKPWEVDFFNTAQKLRTGAVPVSRLASDLVSHRYAMIQAGSTTTPPALLWVPPLVNAALTEHYTPVRHSAHGILLIPK